MPKKRSWTDEELERAVINCRSYRAVLMQLHLIPAGGNYVQVKRRIKELSLKTTHFAGKGWNIGLGLGLQFRPMPALPLENLLVAGGTAQSHRLKRRLFAAGLKKPKCELCGRAKQSPDGRVPVELDHINGDRTDNRLGNLRILCPNCHSLQLTHRGKNEKVRLHYARVS